MATKDKMQTTAGSWALLGSTVSFRSQKDPLSEQRRGMKSTPQILHFLDWFNART